MTLPKLYAIMDAETLRAHNVSVTGFANELRHAGVTLIQYRDKQGGPQEILRAATEISAVFAVTNATLILNDRADLAALASWSGVHVGHLDLAPNDARSVLGAAKIIGVSTHNDEQVIAADASEADYIAVGPIFATSTKQNAEPVIGLEGVRRARALTQKPIVAIGSITRENARSVIDAGADSVAVIGALMQDNCKVSEIAEDFLRLLR